MQKQFRMKIGYSLIGCTPQFLLNHRYEFLKKCIPNEFYYKNIYDFGCGDGKSALNLKKLFKAKTYIGYENNPNLIKKANKK